MGINVIISEKLFYVKILKRIGSVNLESGMICDESATIS